MSSIISRGFKTMTMISGRPNSDLTAFDEVVARTNLVKRKILGPRPFPAHKTAIAAGLIGTCALVLAFGTRPERQRALEATTRMERLATALDHSLTIAPDTAREIAHLIGQPQYHCSRIRCGAALDVRNRKARIKLKTLLGTASASDPPIGN
jgi:hypothetical protein